MSKYETDQHYSSKINYDKSVLRTLKNSNHILMGLDTTKTELIHGALILSGEAGELVDLIKKHTMYSKKLDIDEVINEMGDIEYALSVLRQALEISREEVLLANIEKLEARHPSGYNPSFYGNRSSDNTTELLIKEK